MKNKVLSITKKIPKTTTLPNGYYNGIWGGYIIEVDYSNERYELTTEIGVKGVNIHVVVKVIDGNITFDKVNK